MPAIAAAVAVVRAAFLTLVTLVLAYFAFVVPDRPRDPAERYEERPSGVAVPRDRSPH